MPNGNGARARLAVTIAVSFALHALPSRCQAVCTPVTAGSSLQAAVDAASPGDTLCLEAGLYEPAATVVINKSLTILGPQAGVDPRPSVGSLRVAGGPGEARIDGRNVLATILRITSDDVTLDGIEVLRGTGDLIDSPSATTILDPIVVQNCIIHGSGDEGIQLRSTTLTLIQYNHVYDTSGDAINLCCGSTLGTIRYNEAHQIRLTDGAIYIYDLTAGTTVLNHLIEHNLVYDCTNNDGIKVGSKDGGDRFDGYVTVQFNTIHDMAQDGVTVYMSHVDVLNNEMYRGKSENGVVFVSYPVTAVNIASNSIHDNGPNPGAYLTYGVRVGKSSYYPSSVTVNDNCIFRNQRGLFYNTKPALPPLDAEDNWWNSADGPSGCTGCTGSGDTVSDNVDYTPFLVANPGCAESAFRSAGAPPAAARAEEAPSMAPPAVNNDDTGIDENLLPVLTEAGGATGARRR